MTWNEREGGLGAGGVGGLGGWDVTNAWKRGTGLPFRLPVRDVETKKSATIRMPRRG